jgi:hypothetical protein
VTALMRNSRVSSGRAGVTRLFFGDPPRKLFVWRCAASNLIRLLFDQFVPMEIFPYQAAIGHWEQAQGIDVY